MHANDWMQILLYLAVLVALTPPVGGFIARVLEGQPHLMSKPLGWLERLSYRAAGTDPEAGMDWKRYASALLWFNALGIAALMALQLLQGRLGLNPQALAAVSWHSAFNTAVSFVTNTNWQGYGGESTLSYLTQLAGLTVQNFLSAATGIAVAAALIRGLRNHQNTDLGNFWADLTRLTVHVLLPLSFVFAVFLVGQGVVQNLKPYDQAKTVEGVAQVLPQGPAASQEAIKQLGTNGGGFFNANSAHPYENPTPLSNFWQDLTLLLISSSLCWTFGVMIKKRREGISLWAAMTLLMLLGLGAALWAEYQVNPVFGVGGVMEGKEQRFGVTPSVLFAVTTTDASCGAVNSMHDSYSPIGGMIPMLNIMLGEIVYGGVGSGLYGMLVYVLLTVFMAGLMVGRTPEYLGKKLGASEISWVVAAILLPNAAIKLGTALAVMLPAGLAGLNNQGPHGFSEILYAFTSCAGNNGSAFAGLSVNTVFYNLVLGVTMLVGRFGVILPVLAVAGSLAKKKAAQPSSGTFATDSPLFVGLLVSVILIVSVLAFMPALCLGPLVEHFLMAAGRTF